MKKAISTFSFILGAVAISVAQQAIEVPQTQNSILTKKTAQWCPPCGGWAWNFYEDILQDNPDHVLLVTAQIPGGSSSAAVKIETETSGAITSNFGSGSSRPLIYLNNDNQGVLSHNVSEKKADILDKIQRYATELPIAQTGIKAEFTESDLIIKTNTKFFQPASGDFALGIYTIRKSVIADQSGRSGQSDHKNVLGDELTDNPLGSPLMSGEISQDTELPVEITVPLNQLPELSNLILGTIVWEDDGGRFKMVNVNFTDTFTEFQEEMQDTTSTTTSTDFRITEVKHLRVFPTGLNQYNQMPLQVEFELGRSYEDVEASIYTLNGKRINQFYQGSLMAGVHNFSWVPESHLPSGMYLMKLKIGGEAIVRKFMLE